MKLSNEFLEVTVQTKGAELSSVLSKGGYEYIWQADPNVWARHAPNLFPIVGKLKDDTFTYQKEEFTLGQHGFARDMEFDLVKWNPGELVLSLKSSMITLQSYPFEFDFRITYTLKGRTLTQKFTVESCDEEVMPVSFGAHPAFNADPISGYYLEFEKEESELSDTVVDGIRNGIMRTGFDGNQIQLSDTIFDQDALIFSKLNSQNIILRDKGHSPLVGMTFKDFPYLGIWSKPKANFVCIEPWCGIADKKDASGNVLEKEGMMLVPPGQEISRRMEMTFHKD